MQILAEKREKLGKQSKKLKAVRKIPAVVYGSGLESTALEIDLINFGKVYKEAGETSLIDLKFNDSNEKVLIKEVQYNPVTLIPLHASFFKVNLKEKIKANIPVHVIGEEESPIIKSKEAYLSLRFKSFSSKNKIKITVWVRKIVPKVMSTYPLWE